MTRKRRALGLSIMALFTVFGLCLWLGCQDFPQQLQRLPDGNTLRVIGVTHPHKPQIETGAPVFRLLGSAIPYEHHEQLGLGTWSSGSSPVTVWIRFGKDFEPSSPMARVNGVLRVWDEYGNCAASRIGSLYHYDYHPVYNIWLDPYPRRGTELRLELFSDDGVGHLEHLAKFEITNPLRGDYPVWVAAPLPDRQTDRGVTATLQRLETGVPDEQAPHKLRGQELLESGQPVWTVATLSLEEAGRPSDHWVFEAIEIRDATGNRFAPDLVFEERSRGRIVLRLLTSLWNEPAWKLEMLFRRIKSPRPYGPREVYVDDPVAGKHFVTSSSTRKLTFQVRPTIH